MSYFEIGVFHVKTHENIGTLLRSAYQLGAAGVFTIGRRYSRQATDTTNATVGIPLRHYETLGEFLANRPVGAVLVGVEMGGVPLGEFLHPMCAVYLLGAEDCGLSYEAVKACNAVVTLDHVRQASYNVAVAGSIVMYDRVFGGLRRAVLDRGAEGACSVEQSAQASGTHHHLL